MMPAYPDTMREVLALLMIAKEEALAEIPDDFKKKHYIDAKHDPSAWKTIHHAHMSTASPPVRTALLAIYHITVDIADIEGLLLETDGLSISTPPDLRLRPMRKAGWSV